MTCANTLHVTDDLFERFHAKVKQKFDLHLNEYEGKFTVGQVGTNSVSSQREQNHEDNQRKMMKGSEELIKLLQTETTHIVKTNEQSLKQAKPILRTSSRAIEVGITHLITLRNIWIWLMVVRTWVLRMERTITAER